MSVVNYDITFSDEDLSEIESANGQASVYALVSFQHRNHRQNFQLSHRKATARQRKATVKEKIIITRLSI